MVLWGGLLDDGHHFELQQHAVLQRMDRDVTGWPVLRIGEALADLAAILGPRPAVIARELTKLNEEVQRGTLSDLAQMAASRDIKGEIVLLVGPPAEPQISDDIIRARLATALASSSLRDAARAVARDLGITKSRVYALGVDISRGTALNDPCDDGPE